MPLVWTLSDITPGLRWAHKPDMGTGRLLTEGVGGVWQPLGHDYLLAVGVMKVETKGHC